MKTIALLVWIISWNDCMLAAYTYGMHTMVVEKKDDAYQIFKMLKNDKSKCWVNLYEQVEG